MTTVKERTVAKKKSETNESPTKAVKIDRGIAGKAEMIAKDRGIDLASYVSEAIRATVDRDWAKLVRKLDEVG